MITVMLLIPLGIPEKLSAGESEAPSHVFAAGSSPSAPMAGSLTLNTDATLTVVAMARDEPAVIVKAEDVMVRPINAAATLYFIIWQLWFERAPCCRV
jgi:hypothetical protein